jgi:hypothetical protein
MTYRDYISRRRLRRVGIVAAAGVALGLGVLAWPRSPTYEVLYDGPTSHGHTTVTNINNIVRDDDLRIDITKGDSRETLFNYGWTLNLGNPRLVNYAVVETPEGTTEYGENKVVINGIEYVAGTSIGDLFVRKSRGFLTGLFEDQYTSIHSEVTDSLLARISREEGVNASAKEGLEKLARVRE